MHSGVVTQKKKNQDWNRSCSFIWESTLVSRWVTHLKTWQDCWEVQPHKLIGEKGLQSVRFQSRHLWIRLSHPLHSDWTAVWRWESWQGSNSLLFFHCSHNYFLNFHVNNWVRQYECLAGETVWKCSLLNLYLNDYSILFLSSIMASFSHYLRVGLFTAAINTCVWMWSDNTYCSSVSCRGHRQRTDAVLLLYNLPMLLRLRYCEYYGLGHVLEALSPCQGPLRVTTDLPQSIALLRTQIFSPPCSLFYEIWLLTLY